MRNKIQLESIRRNILAYLKLNDNASVKDICNGLQEVLRSEQELQKKNGQPGVLPPNDPNHQWINECNKKNVTMESLMQIFQRQ